MFDFFNDLFGEIEKHSYRYQVSNGKQIVVEGYKSVLKVDESNVILKLFDGELEIVGNNLSIKQLGTNTIKIIGKIYSVCQTGVTKWKIDTIKFTLL